jgi:glycogen phosphorylase
VDPSVTIAYFSMEVAIDETMPTYSGGLGILAGDTLRAAADGGLPIVGVTLVYHRGYYRQMLDTNGHQTEAPETWDAAQVLRLSPHVARIEIEGRTVHVRAWRYDIVGARGSVPVLLLDTDVPENDLGDRRLTDELYGGDRRYRLAQEAILGIAGKQIADAFSGHAIERYHMNEGHSALVVPTLLNEFHGDVERVRAACIFTTHTPVPAGHDRFDRATVEAVLDPITRGGLVALGQLDAELNMTTVALIGSGYRNAVAMKHGEVSRAMFPGYDIAAITNGVHAATWVCPEMARLFDARIPGWREDNFRLRQVQGIPRIDLQAAHRHAKEAMLAMVRERSGVALDPMTFTIGFARRAATYKRADLLFTDIERLKRIARERGPIQIIYGGKAHPQDNEGKELIRRVQSAMDALRGSIRAVYIENYDMAFAKRLVPGVDLWLNTPRRPEEASGTSGMKAALNGVPSLSILDGWWIEGHVEGKTGWSVGGTDGSADDDVPSLYHKLDERIVPLFYHDPAGYAEVMRYAIVLNGSYFTTERMVHEYLLNAYREAATPVRRERAAVAP